MKKCLALILIIVMINSSFPGIVYSEMEETNPLMYYPYNSWAFDIGVKHSLIFTENNGREVKRWEVVSILHGMIPTIGFNNDNIVFTDIDDIDEPLRNKILSMVNCGVISGYSDGTFRPYDNVTRAEFAVMLDRTDLLKGKTQKKVSFDDITDHWAVESILNVASTGIVTGKGEGIYCPEDNITPQEILVIIDRIFELDIITQEQLIESMTGTFKCQQYGDKDRYLVEVIFKDIDEIQQKMWAYRNTFIGYNYDELDKPLTFKDVLYWKYYYGSGNIGYDHGAEGPLLNDVEFRLKQTYNLYMGYEGEIDYDKQITVIEFLKGLSPSGRSSKEYNFKSVDFSNFLDFPGDERKSIVAMLKVECLPNSEYSFPAYEPLTKAMLNYITVKMNESFDWNAVKHNKIYNGTAYTETDVSTYPNNYEQYPYIFRPITNEAYEIPFLKEQEFMFAPPVEVYNTVANSYWTIPGRTNRFFDKTTLNIDYRTIDENVFKKNIEEVDCWADSDSWGNNSVEGYINYVKENKIIIKGESMSCLPIVYNYHTDYRVRTLVRFTIESAETNKNLLFGDQCSNNDIIYDGKEFELYVDIPMGRGLDRKQMYVYPHCLFDYIAKIKCGNITSDN